MKKLDRREYLKRMGIAAMGTVGAGQLDRLTTALSSQRNILSGTRASLSGGRGLSYVAPPAVEKWPTFTRKPPQDINPGVRLIFMGMTVFTYKEVNKRTEGRVAFHRGSQHRFGIALVKNCQLVQWWDGDTQDIKKIELQAENKKSDIRFFQLDDFDRKDDNKSHPKDFSWLLDLESSSLGNTSSGRTDKLFKTKLRVSVPDTTFYTYQHTESRFYIGDPSNKVGHVAMVMAADVPFDTIDCVSFQVNNDTKKTLCRQDGLYEIYFLNLCRSDQACSGGDFGMVFDAFDSPKRFELTLDGQKGNTKWPDNLCLLEPPKDWSGNRISDIVKAYLNDDAPCMGGGLGSGGGFP